MEMSFPKVIKNKWGVSDDYIRSVNIENETEKDKFMADELARLQSVNPRIVGIKPACTDKYTIEFTKSDFKPDPDIYGYSIIIKPDSFDKKKVSYCTILVDGGEDGLQLNTGILDDIEYMTLYKENGDILINTKYPFNGTAIIDTARIFAAEVIFTVDSWVQDGSSWCIKVYAETFDIKSVYYADVLVKYDDSSYVKNYGILDDIDYIIIYDGNGIITIVSKSPFDGKILIKGDI